MPFSMVKDGKPLVGQLLEGIWIIGGLGCCGITIGPMAAKIVSDAICDEGFDSPESPRILRELCPLRMKLAAKKDGTKAYVSSS